MPRENQGSIEEFARLNRLEDWDPDKLWVEPLLFFANGAMAIIRNRKRQMLGGFDGVFELLCLPGHWQCPVGDNTDELFDKKKMRPIRNILQQLATDRQISPKAWTQLKKLIGTVELTGAMSLEKRPGKISVGGQASVTSGIQWLALIILEIVRRDLDDRVRMCELPTCGNFFIAWPTRGPQQRYCTKGHASHHRVLKQRGQA